MISNTNPRFSACMAMTTFILLGLTSKSVQVTFREGFSSCYARAAISPFFMHFRCPYRSKYTFAELFDKSKKTGFSEKCGSEFGNLFFVFISLERTREARHFELLFARIGSRSSENEAKQVFIPRHVAKRSFNKAKQRFVQHDES